MRLGYLRSVALLCVLAAPVPSWGGAPEVKKAEKADAPGLIVRIRALDGLLSDVEYLAKLVGKEEEAKQFQKIIEVQAGGKEGLSGFDMKRPMGLYGTVGPAVVDSTAVALIPIADEKAALGLLENLNLKAAKDDDDVYTITPDKPGVPAVYFRFANKYAYVTAQNKGSIDKDKLLDPATIFPAGDKSLVTVIGRIDQIPAGLRKAFISQFELKMEEAKRDNIKGDTEAQKELQKQMFDGMMHLITRVTDDGGAVELHIDLDRKTEEVSVEVSLAGAPKTEMAASIKKLGDLKSLFAGLAGKNSAASGLAHVTLPETLRKAIGPALDEAVKKEVEKEKDKAKRDQAEKALAALMPSLKAGELDAAFDLRGPSEDKHYTLVAGVMVKNGADLDKVVRQAVADLPAADKKKVTFDVEKVGSVAIHELNVAGELDADAKTYFGENAKAYFAIRPDAIVVTVGDHALNAIKEAVALAPKAAKTLSFEMSLARLAPLMEKDNPGSTEAAEKAFGKNKDADKVRITVEGGDKIKLRLTMKAQVIKFGSMVDEAKKK